jgi:hypothetical protein
MPSRGFIIFSMGTKCATRIGVFLYTLRKHWNGPVCIISAGDASKTICQPLLVGNPWLSMVELGFDSPLGDNKVFLDRAKMWNVTPFDTSVAIDVDAVIVGDMSPLFELTEQNEFIISKFSNWTTAGRSAKRVQQWADIYPAEAKKALEMQFPVLNGGLMGSIKGSKFTEIFYDLMLPGRSKYLVDETFAMTMLHKYPHMLVDQKYNCSCKHSNPKDPDTRMVHFHGNKHCRASEGKWFFNAEMWVKEHNDLMKTSDLGMIPFRDLARKMITDDNMLQKMRKRKEIVIDNNGELILGQKSNPSIKNTIISIGQESKPCKGCGRKHGVSSPVSQLETTLPLTPSSISSAKAITIVTAVSPEYVERLNLAVQTWKLKKELIGAPLTIFCDRVSSSDLQPIRDEYPDVKLVPWDWSCVPSCKDQRELMLSAFVLGSAKYVSTNYWLKIDADAFFVDNSPLITPDLFEYEFAAPGWGSSWAAHIIALNDWASKRGMPGDPIPVVMKDSKRCKMKRIISYVCLHRSAFVRECADIAGSRLPAPSHDTYLWYVAQRLGKRWGIMSKGIGVVHSARKAKVQAFLDGQWKPNATETAEGGGEEDENE